MISLDDVTAFFEPSVVSITTDRSVGTGFYIAPNVVATCHHVIKNARNFKLNGASYSKDDIVFHSENHDLTLIRMRQLSDNWMIPDEAPSLGKKYLFISNIEGKVETGLVTLEGYRRSNDKSEIKFAEGQITPGFSGAPVVNVESAHFVGLIRTTRNQMGPHGGYTVPSARLIKLRRDLDLDRDDHKMHAKMRAILIKPNAVEITDLTVSPFRNRPYHGRQRELRSLFKISKPNWIVSVSGVRGIGKSALATHWIYNLKSSLFERRAYFDISMFPVGDFPVLRSITAQLSLSVDPDPFGQRTVSETAALIRWKISQSLSSAVVVLDNAVLDPGSDTEQDLLALIHGDGLSAAATVLCVMEPPSWPDLSIQIAEPIILGPLDSRAASLLVSEVLPHLREDVIQDFVELLSDTYRSPGLLKAIAGSDFGSSTDPYELAQGFLDSVSARFTSFLSDFFLGMHVSEHQELIEKFLDLLIDRDQVTIADLCHQDRDIPAEIRHFGHVPLTLSILMSVRFLRSPILEALIVRAREDRLGDNNSVSARLLGELAEGTDPLIVQARAELSHRLLLDSRSDDLGAIDVPAAPPTNDHLSNWVRALRALGSSSGGRSKLLDLNPLGVTVELAALELLRRELQNADTRHDYPLDVELLRRRLLSNIPADLCHSTVYFQILSDSCQASSLLGFHEGLKDRLDVLLEISSDDIELRALSLRAMAQSVLSRQPDASSIAERFRVSFFELLEYGLPETAARVLAGEFVRACAISSAEPSTYKQILEWAMSCATNAAALQSDPGSVSRLIATVASSLDMSGYVEDLEKFLVSATTQLLRHRDVLEKVAKAGNNRPMLCLGRQLRRAARVQRITRPRSVLVHTEKAIEVLRWVTECAPSHGAWLTLLKAVKGRGERPIDGFYLNEMLSAREALSIARLGKEYRTWARGKPYNARRIEIEYFLLKEAWGKEGSLLRIAAESDPHWVKRPLNRKLDKLENLYEVRLRRLQRLAQAFGETETGLIMAASLESQYQTSKSILKRVPVRTDYVDDVLARGLVTLQHSIRLQLEQARYLRHRRDFPAALEAFEQIQPHIGGDAETIRAYKVDWAETLVQFSANGSPNRQAMCSKALNLVADAEGTNADAAMVAMRARLEIDEGKLPPDALRLRDFFASDVGYANLAGNSAAAFRRLGEEASSSEMTMIVTCVASDFTSPRLLMGFGSYLIRSFILDRSSGLTTLNAALNCLDGARIMSEGHWFPPILNFHTGLALTIAVRHTRTEDPLGWSKRMGFDYDSDKSMGLARLQAAADLSVGEFRDLIRDYSNNDSLVAPRFDQ